MQKRWIAGGLAALAAGAVMMLAQAPKFAPDNKLEFPADYREWVYLSSGRGMTYGPAANPNGPPLFDNVFVKPEAYREFIKTGAWPDKSVFVLEIRRAGTEGSINKGGQFQRDLVSIEVEVKDTQRFKDTDGWAYFNFGQKQDASAQLAKTESCYGCHSQNAGVEHTFVQFYPTLVDIAKAHGTFRETK
ncbi:MAG: cytochrome P460 family protein [Acidobacteriota bacterium]